MGYTCTATVKTPDHLFDKRRRLPNHMMEAESQTSRRQGGNNPPDGGPESAFSKNKNEKKTVVSVQSGAFPLMIPNLEKKTVVSVQSGAFPLMIPNLHTAGDFRGSGTGSQKNTTRVK